MKMVLYKHQQEALGRAMEGNLALFHECGTGKTLTALKIIEYHKQRIQECRNIGIQWNGALVVCPLSIIESAWIEDCRRFTPQLSIISLWSQRPQERLRRLRETHDIFLVNFETFKMIFEEIKTKGFDILIIDESSKMKAHDSQITRALMALAGVRSRGKGTIYPASRAIPHRYILSGTPAPNDRSEYWSQITFIAPGMAFSDNFYSFRGRYFVPRPLGRTGINLWDFTKDGTLQEEFKAQMAPWCHVVRKADAVDLPEQVHQIRKVELSKAERKAYETFRDELVLRFAKEEILASSALTEIMKLRQLTSGFCYGTMGIHQTGKSKLKELLSLLEEIGDKPVIIWCNFRHEIGEILKAIPDATALWSGSPDREKVIADFKTGKCRILVANPQSAGHGLTFTNCCDAVYFSMNYSWELQKQSQDRIHRIGQKSKCTYTYLIARDTIDELIYDTVTKKQKISEEVLKYLRTQEHKNTGI
jgi:SNF2 family DNA or RNA helicase